MHRVRHHAARIIEPAQSFIRTEASSGIILAVLAAFAIAWANSPWDGAYRDFFSHKLTVDAGIFRIDEDVRGWINEGLMTVFFFVVGLEMKRELSGGELAGRRAILPAVAAAGGMLVPALIYTVFNAAGDGARGWGIPMATDAAFALGVLALARKVPAPVRIFLLAMAIADDIGSIVVIAAFYSRSIDLAWLALSVALLAAMFELRHSLMRSHAAFAAAALVVWLAALESGVSTAIAGVALGLVTLNDSSAGDSTLIRRETLLHPVAGFAIVPLFALANAGVDLGSGSLASSVTLGVIAGRVIGKPVGIVLFALIAVRLGVATLPKAMTVVHVAAIGALGGVGFTVALLVNNLAFGEGELAGDAKLGVIIAAVVSGAVGYALLVLAGRTDATGR